MSVENYCNYCSVQQKSDIRWMTSEGCVPGAPAPPSPHSTSSPRPHWCVKNSRPTVPFELPARGLYKCRHCRSAWGRAPCSLRDSARGLASLQWWLKVLRVGTCSVTCPTNSDFAIMVLCFVLWRNRDTPLWFGIPRASECSALCGRFGEFFVSTVVASLTGGRPGKTVASRLFVSPGSYVWMFGT